MGQFYLYLEDKVVVSNHIAVEVMVSNDNSSGISLVNPDANVRYYDLFGSEVVNPAKGIYVKVANGKASKVIIK